MDKKTGKNVFELKDFPVVILQLFDQDVQRHFKVFLVGFAEFGGVTLGHFIHFGGCLDFEQFLLRLSDYLRNFECAFQGFLIHNFVPFQLQLQGF